MARARRWMEPNDEPLPGIPYTEERMATKNLSKSSPVAPQKPAVKETSKQKLSPEVREEIARCKKRTERFAQMMQGLHGFCFNVDEGCEAYEFSFAIATIAEMIKDDAELTAKNLGDLLEGELE